MSKRQESSKIQWLAVLQGMAMLFVVLGHSELYGGNSPKENIIIKTIGDVIYQFHMPLMFMISGYLFYFTSIRKEKAFNTLMTNKLHRLGVPFLAFTFITVFLKMAFSSLMKRQVSNSIWGNILDVFVYGNNPLGEMWFIYVLLVLMALYPIYKLVLKNKVLEVVFFLLTLGLCIEHDFFLNYKYFYSPEIATYLVFFYGGILFSKYNMIDEIINPKILVLLTFLLVGINFYPFSTAIRALIDCIFCFALCKMVGTYLPNLFASFRNYTFQIYLMGIFFQMGIKYIWLRLPASEILYFTLWIANVLLALYMPVLISKMAEKNKSNILLKSALGLN